MVGNVVRCVSVLPLIAAIAACSSSSTKTAPTTGSAAPVVMALDSIQFSPVTVTVKVGQEVTWKNGGSINHTVTFDAGPSFSKPLNAGASVTRTFTATGTFAYHCSIHGPVMHGTIVVVK
jgi:plastocyanin